MVHLPSLSIDLQLSESILKSHFSHFLIQCLISLAVWNFIQFDLDFEVLN